MTGSPRDRTASDTWPRWDRAYQAIVRWSLETEGASNPSANGKEKYHADCAYVWVRSFATLAIKVAAAFCAILMLLLTAACLSDEGIAEDIALGAVATQMLTADCDNGAPSFVDA
jgi:hypothetical protein